MQVLTTNREGSEGERVIWPELDVTRNFSCSVVAVYLAPPEAFLSWHPLAEETRQRGHCPKVPQQLNVEG